MGMYTGQNGRWGEDKCRNSPVNRAKRRMDKRVVNKWIC